MQLPAPPRQPRRWACRQHGGGMALAEPATWPGPQVTTSTATSRYGRAVAAAWDRVHPRLTHRAAWLDHAGDLPVIEGTLIRLQVDHLPGERYLSRCGCGPPAPALPQARWTGCGKRLAPLRPGTHLPAVQAGPRVTAPKIRDPAAADRWTWLVITCHAQLRLARPLADDLRLPWERPAPPGRPTPARVRRGFRNIRATIPCPAGAPKPGKPGPGLPTRIEEPPPRTAP